jgi:hypothetical protein
MLRFPGCRDSVVTALDSASTSSQPGRLAPGRELDLEVHRDREHVALAGLLARLAQLGAAPVHLMAATQANGTPAPSAPLVIAVPIAGLVVNAVPSGTPTMARAATC